MIPGKCSLAELTHSAVLSILLVVGEYEGGLGDEGDAGQQGEGGHRLVEAAAVPQHERGEQHHEARLREQDGRTVPHQQQSFKRRFAKISQSRLLALSHLRHYANQVSRHEIGSQTQKS